MNKLKTHFPFLLWTLSCTPGYMTFIFRAWDGMVAVGWGKTTAGSVCNDCMIPKPSPFTSLLPSFLPSASSNLCHGQMFEELHDTHALLTAQATLKSEHWLMEMVFSWFQWMTWLMPSGMNSSGSNKNTLCRQSMKSCISHNSSWTSIEPSQ